MRRLRVNSAGGHLDSINLFCRRPRTQSNRRPTTHHATPRQATVCVPVDGAHRAARALSPTECLGFASSSSRFIASRQQRNLVLVLVVVEISRRNKRPTDGQSQAATPGRVDRHWRQIKAHATRSAQSVTPISQSINQNTRMHQAQSQLYTV